MGLKEAELFLII